MYRLFALSFLVLLTVGCGSGLDTASVSGVITLDDKPLPSASVTFTPQGGDDTAPASNGLTDSSGRYTLTVTVTGDDGAVVGNHIVTIALAGEEKTGEDADVIDPEEEDALPDHNFTYEVKPGSNDDANFNLES